MTERMVIGRVIPAPAGLIAPVIETLRPPEARVVALIEAATRWAKLRKANRAMTPELMTAAEALAAAAAAFEE